MKLILKNGTSPEDVVKRMMFLAYSACGGPMGMGILQARDDASEQQVWDNAYGRGDYPGGRSIVHRQDNEVYGDYVFGRMMKWGCRWGKDTVVFRDREFRGDYQSFARSYPNDKALAVAALESLGVKEFEFVESPVSHQ